MHIDPYIVLGSAVIGFLVGMTGAGGGALMTPMLILLFGVQAVGGDLERPRRGRRDAPDRSRRPPAQGHRQLRLVGWMVLGSVPMAFVGAYLLHLLGAREDRPRQNIELVLGAALLLGAAAMVLRYVLDRRAGRDPHRGGPRGRAGRCHGRSSG